MILSFLMDIVILLLAAVLIVPVTQALRLGSVPGFLFAGILVGPAVFGLVDNVKDISHFAEIGVILLLFIIGVELKPARLWMMRRLVFGLGTLQVVLTGVLISGVSVIFLGVTTAEAVLIGPALALSSTAFVLQLLMERRALTTHYGRSSFAILLLQDLAVIPLITLVTLMATPQSSMGIDLLLGLLKGLFILLLVVAFGRYFLQPILHRIALTSNSDLFTACSILLVLGTAIVTEQSGLSMGLGAFVAGLLISDSTFRHQMKAEIQPFRGLLLGLFFISMGMSIDLQKLFQEPLTILGLTVALMLLKFLMLVPLAYLFGLRGPNPIAVALLLAQGGEFALMLFAMAHEADVMSSSVFQYSLLVILISMILTPPLAALADRLAHIKHKAIQPTPEIESATSTDVVIAGYGRVGRRIGEILQRAGIAFVAIDIDPTVVQSERDKGVPIFYGDVRNPEVLRAADVEAAHTIVVTASDETACRDLVSSLHWQNPSLTILARGRNKTQCIQLKKLGAAGAVSENLEASIELAHLVLEQVNYDLDARSQLVNEFRKAYYDVIDTAAK